MSTEPSDSVLLLARALQAVIDDTVKASEERMKGWTKELVHSHRHVGDREAGFVSLVTPEEDA